MEASGEIHAPIVIAFDVYSVGDRVCPGIEPDLFGKEKNNVLSLSGFEPQLHCLPAFISVTVFQLKISARFLKIFVVTLDLIYRS